MNYTAKEISLALNGNIEGDPDVTINSIANIEDAKSSDLTFLSSSKYNSYLYSTKASIIIIGNDFKLEHDINATIIRVDDPYLRLSQLLKIFDKEDKIKSGIDEKSEISTTAKISESCYIGPFVYIGHNVDIGENVEIHPHCYIGNNVKINDHSILYPGVKIYQNCIIGRNNIMHSGAVIGSDGFGFAPNSNRAYEKIRQIGNVITHNHVEIGANTSIDRATLGSTVIKEGVKLDNQIQIGHNVEIGKNTVIAGLTGIAGSTKIGNNCMIGGSTGIAGHLKIGDNVRIAGHTGVGSNIKEGSTIQGPYAFNQKDFLRSYTIFKRLPEMYKKLNEMSKELKK